MALRLIGYVRVSRVAGRAGDSFISPEVQRERIEAMAKAGGHTVVEWAEDLDQPGSKIDRPAFQEALEAVERGEADGIAVAKLDRFARSVSKAGEALERLEAAGGVLLAVDLGMDTSTSTGKLMRNVLMALAEFELDRIREQWDVSRGRAIARGAHICKVPPVGYRRGEDGRLEPDPETAPVVREVFQRRGAGESWSALCEFLDERLPRENGGAWTRQTIDSIIARRTYLGIAFQGDIENRDAHKPIVTRAEWEAAQAGKRLASRRSSAALLAGLLRCAGCGYLMSRVSDGARGYWNYRCRGRHSAGVCPEPARISLPRIEEHLEREFLAWVESERLVVEASETTSAIEHAQTALEAAEAELRAYLAENLVTIVGPESYREALIERQRSVDVARVQLADARQTETTPLLGAHDLAETWPELSTDERSRLLRAAIDAVFVRQAHLPGKGSPAAGRVAILWRGEGPADLPGRGSTALRPFVFPDRPRELRVAGAHQA